MRAIKNARPAAIEHALDRLGADLEMAGLAEFLGADVALIPVPRSAPLSSPSALWPARVICQGLVKRGLGGTVLACLSRSEPVQRSSTASKGERPDAETHLRTITIKPEILTLRRVTLVDDVVTIGRTILAAASHVAGSYANVEIRGFGLFHTLGMGKELNGIVAPYVGRLALRGRFIVHDPTR